MPLGRINRIAVLGISIVLLILTIYKANTACLTHDESLTYNSFYDQDVLGVITYQNPERPVDITNNHVLNTLGVQLFTSLFGVSELTVRMPSIIALIIYLMAVWLLVKNLKEYLVIPAFVLMTCNPFLLDFFALARGYGIAISCITCSIYCYSRYLQHLRIRAFSFSLFWAILAVLASFAMLHYFLILIFLHNVFLVVTEKPWYKSVIKKNIPSLVAVVILTALVYGPISKILKYDLVEIGGVTGFWNDTVGTLVIQTMHESGNAVLLCGLKILSIVVMAAIPLCFVFAFAKRRTNVFIENKLLCFTWLILVFIIIDTHLQHSLLGTQFMTERVALFIIPIFMLNLVLLANMLLNMFSEIKPITYAVVVGISGVMLLHTFSSYTPNYYPIWKSDMYNKAVINELEKQHKDDGEMQVGITWIFEPSLNFYRHTRHLTWLHDFTREGLKDNDNYEYLLKSDTIPAKYKTEVIRSFSENNAVLLKRL